jgi:hypothetical protein
MFEYCFTYAAVVTLHHQVAILSLFKDLSSNEGLFGVFEPNISLAGKIVVSFQIMNRVGASLQFL